MTIESTTPEKMELRELEAEIEEAREELGAAAVAFEEARHRRDAVVKCLRSLLEKRGYAAGG